LHDLFNRSDRSLCDAHNINLLPSILSAVEQHPLVEQIVKLAAVNFIKAHLQEIVRETFQQGDDVESCEQVEPRY